MKKILLLLLTVFLAGKTLTAQTTPDNDSTRVYTKVAQPPAYKGGDAAWIHFLQKNLQYPMDAIENEMKGTVMVEFIVNTDGTLSNIKAITNPGKPLVAEAIRIVTLSSGNWVPAMQSGKAVRCYSKKPIIFRLEK